ncbi:SCO family protein [Cohnella cholangitidis]|uniref:SCO family protein n=1 Tax=Cohnella cholangitidis TaxID=2598458 RepID=A0A7G5BVD1_9BACL|nr:SCO family protein [Cohnella cholangitidis]QMV40915.1 SCO family protein [Cohnella cholangitidis]
MDQQKDEQSQVEVNVSVNQSAELASAAARPQKPWIQRYGFSLIVLALCLVLGYFILAQQNKEGELPLQGQGAEFSYTDTNGENVTLANTNGKARLLYFFFANCPDVCPPTTFLMSQVQDELKEDGVFGDEVQFLSVTIDPNNDTTEALKDYAERFDADPKGWKFLRGDEKETAELARKYQILVTKDAQGNFGHMNLIVLLDKDGQIRDWISANDYIEEGGDNLSPSDMAKKIKSLL